jgi:hypothetical protein
VLTGTEGTTVGTGVSGACVAVGAGVELAWVAVGVAVRGTGVAEGDGEGLAEGVGEGLADGAASCCEEITAAPRRSSATSATAAKTVKTVDHRSACGRTAAEGGGGGATFTPAGGRSRCSVASGSAGVGFSFTPVATARAVPNGRTLVRPF